MGVLLVAAWLLTQLSPDIAAVRHRQPAPDARLAAGAGPFDPERFARVETTIAASGLLAAGIGRHSCCCDAARTAN
jgi:hypothetical protein